LNSTWGGGGSYFLACTCKYSGGRTLTCKQKRFEKSGELGPQF
jgi:hypothetical protein